MRCSCRPMPAICAGARDGASLRFVWWLVSARQQFGWRRASDRRRAALRVRRPNSERAPRWRKEDRTRPVPATGNRSKVVRSSGPRLGRQTAAADWNQEGDPNFPQRPRTTAQRTLGRNCVQPGNVKNTGAGSGNFKAASANQRPWSSCPRVLYIS